MGPWQRRIVQVSERCLMSFVTARRTVTLGLSTAEECAHWARLWDAYCAALHGQVCVGYVLGMRLSGCSWLCLLLRLITSSGSCVSQTGRSCAAQGIRTFEATHNNITNCLLSRE